MLNLDRCYGLSLIQSPIRTLQLKPGLRSPWRLSFFPLKSTVTYPAMIHHNELKQRNFTIDKTYRG